MGGVDEGLGLIAFELGQGDVQLHGEGETPRLVGPDADLGVDGRLAEVDAVLAGDELQRAVETGGIAGGEELLRIRVAALATHLLGNGDIGVDEPVARSDVAVAAFSGGGGVGGVERRHGAGGYRAAVAGASEGRWNPDTTMSPRCATTTVMNRTERLYALVEELRAQSPRPVPAPALARRFEVSVRTVQRDLDALMRSGVPIWSETGVRGGYALSERRRETPPIALTAGEAVAVAVALARSGEGLLTEDGRSALRKIHSLLQPDERERAQSLLDRVRVVDRTGDVARPVRRAVERAVAAGVVVTLDYADRHGRVTRRAVEAHGLMSTPEGTYLVGWCRLRDDRRLFRLDRVTAAHPTRIANPTRDFDALLAPMGKPARSLRLDGEPLEARNAATIEHVRTELAAVRGRWSAACDATVAVGAAEALPHLVAHLTEWCCWRVALLRSALDRRPPRFAGNRPPLPVEFDQPLAGARREQLVRRAYGGRSLDVLRDDLDLVLDDLERWVGEIGDRELAVAIGIDSEPEGPIGDRWWLRRATDRPALGEVGPLGEWLVGWWSPIAHLRAHGDELARLAAGDAGAAPYRCPIGGLDLTAVIDSTAGL